MASKKAKNNEMTEGADAVDSTKTQAETNVATKTNTQEFVELFGQVSKKFGLKELALNLETLCKIFSPNVGEEIASNTTIFALSSSELEYLKDLDLGVKLLFQDNENSFSLTLVLDGNKTNYEGKIKDLNKVVTSVMLDLADYLKTLQHSNYLNHNIKKAVEKMNKKIKDAKAPLIIKDLDEDVYHRLDAVNNSSLKYLERSPRDLDEYLKGLYLPRETKEEFKIGTAIHDIILRPTVAVNKVIVAPEFNKKSNEGKLEHLIYSLENFDKLYVESESEKTIKRCVDTLLSSKALTDLLKESQTELTVVDKKQVRDVNGVILGEIDRKARYDIICTNPSKKLLKTLNDYGLDIPEGTIIIGDLKSSFDLGALMISRDELERDIYNKKYHRQLAHYASIAKKTWNKEVVCLFFFIEKESGDLLITKLSHGALSVGQVENQMLMEVYVNKFVNSKYRGRSEKIITVDIPGYAYSKISEQLDKYDQSGVLED